MTTRFGVGTQFIRVGSRRKEVETVVDIYTTTNAKGETVSIRYVAEHTFSGQVVTDYDIPAATIARGFILTEV